MRISRRGVILGITPMALAASLAGCVSVPSHYYRLAVVPGTIRRNVTQRIGVRSISIPGYLDQNGIARPGGGYQFNSYPNDLWAESLTGMLQSVMVQDLVQRLPAAEVIGSGGAIGARSDILVEINVLRFDPDASGRVVLTAQVSIETGATRAVLQLRTFTSQAAPAGPGAADIVAVMSTLWAAAADEIAILLTDSKVP